ncbi:hypothetical protein JOE62_001732 [Glutamicibacter nicotianae]|nr:hypothetical protein [Glutamicibacter nicotianae]
MQDHHLREKIMHFDHERIPERVVHARGAGAHGTLTSYGNAGKLCRADFLKPGRQTKVFVRFSTVVGSRGSMDTARDTRGFATKFYTNEGIFDLVGNNIPVFFIQDGIKFPDLVHAAKPHPDTEIPQAQSAHDTFWDFVSLHTPAQAHVMWQMSDPGAIWLASTDADTCVPEHWLQGFARLHADGADAVAGTVEPDRSELDEHLFALWQQEYRPVEGHGHIHGANFGVCAAAYLAVGGFEPLAAREDVALVEALRHAGYRVQATARLQATTSGRLRGRLDEGFADYLATLEHRMLNTG